MLTRLFAVCAGKNIRKLVKDKLIMRRQVQMHSRSRCKAYAEAKRKGKYSTISPTLTPSTHSLPCSLPVQRDLMRYDWFN